MDQTLVSNQVFDKIQEPTEYHSILNGTIIYANRYTGLPKIPMPPDWVDHLDAQGGGIGKNPLIQLEAKLKDMADGPWYIDDRDGILYIHNKDFQADSVHTYVYQQENGEIISVSFSTQSQNGIKTYQSTGMFGSKSLSFNMGGYFGSNHIGTSRSNSSTQGNSESYESYASLPEQIVMPTQKQRIIWGVTNSTEKAKAMASLGHSIRGYASVDKQIEWQYSRYKQTSAWNNLIARAVQGRLRERYSSWEDIRNMEMNDQGHYRKVKNYPEFYKGVISILGREPIYVDLQFTVYQYEKRRLPVPYLPPGMSSSQALSYIKRHSTHVKCIEKELNKIEWDENSKGIYLAHDHHAYYVLRDSLCQNRVYTDVLRKKVITKSYRVYDGATYHSTAIVHMWNYFHGKNRPKTNRK